MRKLTAALVATSLVVSNAYAAPKTVAPLPVGKPAGVKAAAQLGPNAFLILVGVGLLAGGIALTVSNNSEGVTTPTTTGTIGTGLP